MFILVLMLVLLMILLRDHCDVEGTKTLYKKSSWATSYVKGVARHCLVTIVMIQDFVV